MYDFDRCSLKPENFDVTGAELCALTFDDFKERSECGAELYYAFDWFRRDGELGVCAELVNAHTHTHTHTHTHAHARTRAREHNQQKITRQFAHVQ